jgi:hypothetical protein
MPGWTDHGNFHNAFILIRMQHDFILYPLKKYLPGIRTHPAAIKKAAS